MMTGPQWYSIPPWRLTPGGSRPPSCRYLWTASRPVNKVPVMVTSSPTFSARTAASVTGVESWIIVVSVKPFLDLAGRIECHALAAIGPAHVADADEIRGRQPIKHTD